MACKAGAAGTAGVAEVLLENRADVAAQSPEGQTALDIAKGEGHTKVVAMLVAAMLQT